MKALIVYTLLVAAGTVISGLVGLTVEKYVTTPMSLVVFLTMFFANFAVCWMASILVMDGTLKHWGGDRRPLPERA
jgi:hypothetical protein